MPNITLPRLTTSYASVDAINEALAQIEVAVNDCLSRTGASPNQMQADIDANSKRILNLPNPNLDQEPVTLGALRAMSTVVLYEPNPHTHDWTTDITGKPSTFPPSSHTHAISEVVGLASTLSSLQNSVDTLSSEVTVFVQATQPTANAVGDLWFY